MGWAWTWTQHDVAGGLGGFGRQNMGAKQHCDVGNSPADDRHSVGDDGLACFSVHPGQNSHSGAHGIRSMRLISG